MLSFIPSFVVSMIWSSKKHTMFRRFLDESCLAFQHSFSEQKQAMAALCVSVRSACVGCGCRVRYPGETQSFNR